MEPTSTVSSPVDAPARLSYAQKRDLLGQAVAAVLTTALIASPLITPAPGSGDAPLLTALPAESFAAPVAAVAAAAVMESTPRREWRRATSVARKLPSTRYVSVAPAPTAVAPRPVATAASTMGTASARRDLTRTTLSRRLTGWLTGSGTHPVRPFPSVSAARP